MSLFPILFYCIVMLSKFMILSSTFSRIKLNFGDAGKLISKEFFLFAFSEGAINMVGFTAFRMEEHPWI